MRTLLILLALLAFPAFAQPMLEAKLEIRVLDFMIEPASRGEVAVLFDRDNADSLKEANEMLRAFQQSAGLAHSRFAPKLVERHALDQEHDLKAVVLSRFIAESDDDILLYGVSHRTLVLAGGVECVQRKQCAVGVATTPEIQIAVRGDMIRQSGIRFADGFTLMVKEF